MRQRQRRVFIDLQPVVRASSDALLLMRALIDEGRTRSSTASGNLPTDPRVAAKFKQSQFFTGFAQPPGKLPPPNGLIRRKSRVRCDSEVAAELVEFALEHSATAKRVADVCNKTLVELMLNTFNHAAEGRGEDQNPQPPTRWRAAVYCEDGTAYFTFLDMGVGVLRSFAPRNHLRALGASLLGYGQVPLLCDVFRGRIGASAYKPGRGYGLTNMRKEAEGLPFLQLQVLTSSVVGEVAGANFRTVNATMYGTVFRWRTSDLGTES
jgi:hypothetical protein